MQKYTTILFIPYTAPCFLTEDKQDIEYIVQDIYVELYKSLPRFDRTRSFQAWLYGITTRQHQAYRRKKWRQNRKIKASLGFKTIGYVKF